MLAPLCFCCHFQVTRALGTSLLEVQGCIPRVACLQHLLTFFLCLSLFLSPVLEAEAKKACRWLRATGFPKYAQLFEGKVTQRFPLPNPSCLIPPFFSWNMGPIRFFFLPPYKELFILACSHSYKLCPVFSPACSSALTSSGVSPMLKCLVSSRPAALHSSQGRYLCRRNMEGALWKPCFHFPSQWPYFSAFLHFSVFL